MCIRDSCTSYTVKNIQHNEFIKMIKKHVARARHIVLLCNTQAVPCKQHAAENNLGLAGHFHLQMCEWCFLLQSELHRTIKKFSPFFLKQCRALEIRDRLYLNLRWTRNNICLTFLRFWYKIFHNKIIACHKQLKFVFFISPFAPLKNHVVSCWINDETCV